MIVTSSARGCGYRLEYGAGTLEMQAGAGRVLIIDDVLATGGTLRAAADLARLAGYEVVNLAVLISLGLIGEFQWGGLRLRAAIRH